MSEKTHIYSKRKAGGFMNRAALYCRLSKEDKSIANQKLLLTEYAMSNGFVIVKIYEDNDYSGLYDNRRPGFEKMICDARLGLFDTIIAKSQSRFTRNMEHVEKYLHNEFVHLGIRFIGVIDNIDTQALGNKKLRQINGLINEWYCEDLSENIRAVFRQKMLDGQFIAPFAPYGYKKSDKDHHKLIIDEPAANIVRYIFNMYSRNLYNSSKISFMLICNDLNDKKIPPPALYKRLNNFKYSNPAIQSNTHRYNWCPSTIRRILTNETYTGSLIQGVYKKESYKSTKCVAIPKDKWIIIKNCHEPIIDSNLFNTVQTIMHSKNKHSQNRNIKNNVP